MPKIACYPPLPPHLAEQGVAPKEYRAFIDLIAHHQAIAAQKYPPTAGCNGRPLPPQMKNPAAFFFPKGAA